MGIVDIKDMLYLKCGWRLSEGHNDYWQASDRHLRRRRQWGGRLQRVHHGSFPLQVLFNSITASWASQHFVAVSLTYDENLIVSSLAQLKTSLCTFYNSWGIRDLNLLHTPLPAHLLLSIYHIIIILKQTKTNLFQCKRWYGEQTAICLQVSNKILNVEKNLEHVGLSVCPSPTHHPQG